MSRALRRLAVFIAFAVVGACGQSVTPSLSSLEKIIGENDMLKVLNDGSTLIKNDGQTSPIVMPQAIKDAIDAVGLMEPIGCSATHVGDGLVLTAGHCFLSIYGTSHDEPCDGVKVRWGYRADKPAYAESPCKRVVAAAMDDDRDYAIFRVSNPPAARALIDLERAPAEEARLTILGHPQRQPLHWSQFCVLKDRSNGNWGTDQFSHQCDTLPGHSGSAVWDSTTMRIVGIHDGGSAPWNYATFLVRTPLKEILAQTFQGFAN